MNAETIGAVILAAGGSTRLGRPKQLVQYRGETLVFRAARTACAVGCAPVIVVAGDEWERIEKELSPLGVELRIHAEWRRGIGSSIRAGVAHALALAPSLDALVLMVCDQPFVTTEVLTALLTARAKTQKRAIACTYAGTVGVPVLFDRTLFPQLTALPDEQGAKHLLAAHSGEMSRVEFPQGIIDIDTEPDLRAALAPLSAERDL